MLDNRYKCDFITPTLITFGPIGLLWKALSMDIGKYHLSLLIY